MKNILYRIILCFLFSSACLADWKTGLAAYIEGDYVTAYKEFKIRAEQGNPGSQFYLGLMYYEGQGVIQDYKETVKWYRLATEKGFHSAQFNLGRMYYYGEGVTQDIVVAHMWINIAGSIGHAFAKDERDFIAKEMTSDQIAKAQKLARECIKKNYKDCG